MAKLSTYYGSGAERYVVKDMAARASKFIERTAKREVVMGQVFLDADSVAALNMLYQASIHEDD